MVMVLLMIRTPWHQPATISGTEIAHSNSS